ncbi:hypothetical protein BLOT_016296 [Blomia tropicalis]|nr:hypothetical protein BLOT_016296 [Blomia tropicalis]
MIGNIDKSHDIVFKTEMDDGGRCLLDVINDPQLLQSFLDTSNASTSTVTLPNISTGTVVASLGANATTIGTIPNKNELAQGSIALPIVVSSKIEPQKAPPKPKVVRARKSSVVATKTNATNQRQPSPQLQSTQQTVMIGPNGTINFPAGMMPLSLGNGQSINIQQPIGLNPQSQTIRTSGNATNMFPSTPQFQLGPRLLNGLPQQQFQIVGPGAFGAGQQPTTHQFVLTSGPRPTGNIGTQLQPSQQLLQLIQTSQGTQLVPANGQPGGQVVQSSIQTIITPTNTITNSKSNRGSNKQILPKPGTSLSSGKASSKITATQANNIKLLQQQQQQQQQSNQINGTQQILIGSGGQTGSQLITSSQGTFLLNNIGLSNLGSQQILLQGNSLPNKVQLAIRPQAPLFLNANNTLTTNDSSKSQTQFTNQPQTFVISNPSGPQSQGIQATTNNLIMAPNIRSNGSNMIIRPQFLGGPPQPQSQQSQPQFLQLQTPNGPVLVQLNSSSQVGQPTPATILGQSQPLANQQPQPSAIQFGNTVISLNPNTSLNLPAQQTINHPLQTILTQPMVDQNQATNQLSINQPTNQQPFIVAKSQQSNSNANQTKTKTTTASKGLNLADLLKETGILSDFSPPTSPKNTEVPGMTNVVPPIQQSPLPPIQPPPSINTVQQTVVNQNSQPFLFVPGGLNSAPVAPSPQQTLTTPMLAASNPVTPQLRFSLAPDGTLVLLSPNNANMTQQQSSTTGITSLPPLISTPPNTTQTSKLDFLHQQVQKQDLSGIGSSQPSPDSTTPSIDTTTSTSSPTSISNLIQSSGTALNNDSKCLPFVLNDDQSATTIIDAKDKLLIPNIPTSTSIDLSATQLPTTITSQQPLIASQQPKSESQQQQQSQIVNIVQCNSTNILTSITPPNHIILANPNTVKTDNNLKILVNSNQLNSGSIQLVTANLNPTIESANKVQPNATITTPLAIDTSIVKTEMTIDVTPKPISPPIRPELKKQRPMCRAIQQQCNADQNAAVKPDCETPFQSYDDACKRLLRFHVFNNSTLVEDDISNCMLQIVKFVQLFINLMIYMKRQSSPVEHVMLDRLFINDEKLSLQEDRDLVASGKVLNLPPLPELWLREHTTNLKRKLSDDDFDEDAYDSINIQQTKEEISDICSMLEHEDQNDNSHIQTYDLNNSTSTSCNNVIASTDLMSNNNNHQTDMSGVDEFINQLNDTEHHEDHQSFLDSLDQVPLNNSFMDHRVNDELKALYSDIQSKSQQDVSGSNMEPWSNNNNIGGGNGDQMNLFGMSEADSATAGLQSIMNSSNNEDETSLSVDLSGFVDDLDSTGIDHSVMNVFGDVTTGQSSENDVTSFLDADTQGFEDQMDCAIKSIMMSNDNIGIGNCGSGNNRMNSGDIGRVSYQYMRSSTSTSSTINSSSTNNFNNLSYHHHSHHHQILSNPMRPNNMLPYQSSGVSDTLLDEAVRSISILQEHDPT